MESNIKIHLNDHIAVLSSTYTLHVKNIILASEKISSSIKYGGKILIFGNGGSYSDALHFAGELEGRYKMERKALPAIVPNTTCLTAIGNDYGYDKTFQRFVQANAKKEDIVIGISTSGNSKNVVNAIIEARKNKSFTIGFTGESGGKLKDLVDILLNVPSIDTPRVQEAHEFLYHSICYLVEEKLFGK